MGGGSLLDCPMCGHRYDPAANGACGTCPLGKGCAATCCPACGYSSIDPSRSVVVRLGARLARLVALRRAARRAGLAATAALTLDEVQPGTRVRVAAVDGITVIRREQLASYGLSPGRWVHVVQQTPVTVVRVEHIDLAFEGEVARAIHVEQPSGDEELRRAALP